MKHILHSPFSILHSARRDGQVLLITVLALGATILGATTIAGLLLVYQIRQATDLSNSGRAVYAADSGIEWGLYNYYFSHFSTFRHPNKKMIAEPTLTNQTTFEMVCYNGSAVPANKTACSNEDVTAIRAVGKSGNASRSFEVGLGEAD